MKPTGRINPITGEEILRVEEHDIDFWETPWEELTLEQKSMICSLWGIGFLCDLNEYQVRQLFEYGQEKQNGEL